MPAAYHPSQDCSVFKNNRPGGLRDCYPWRKGDIFYGKHQNGDSIEVFDAYPPHKSYGTIKAPGSYNANCTYVSETDADSFIKGNQGISPHERVHAKQSELRTYIRRTDRSGKDGYPWRANETFTGSPLPNGDIAVFTHYKPHTYIGLTSLDTCRETYDGEDEQFRETHNLLEDEVISPYTFPIY